MSVWKNVILQSCGALSQTMYSLMVSPFLTLLLSIVDALETLILTSIDPFSGSEMANIIDHIDISDLLGYKLFAAFLAVCITLSTLSRSVSTVIIYFFNVFYLSACLVGLVIIIS